MKFEHFRKNTYLKNLIKIKKQKLKLGLVSFEVIPIFFNGFKIYEYIEMRYSKQDTTKTDETKLSVRLEKLKWKWTFDNIFALIIILFILINYFYFNIYLCYFNLILPSDTLFNNNIPQFKNFLQEIIFNNYSTVSKKTNLLNFHLNSILLEFMNL